MPQDYSPEHVGNSQGGGNFPAPPPVPPNLADAIAWLATATADNARLLRELARDRQDGPQNRRGYRNQHEETKYTDFLESRPPVFSRADEPLEADDWLRVIGHKLDLEPCSETQKPKFAAQQLRGPASAWWDNFLDVQPAGHEVTWEEFKTAFRKEFIPAGIMKMKLEEFLKLQQGGMSVVQYIARFNHLSQYAREHINTDEKKKDCFIRGLNTKLKSMLTTCVGTSFHQFVDIAIDTEEQHCQHKESKKKKIIAANPGGQLKRQRVIYHPVNHSRFPQRPTSFQARPQTVVRPAMVQSYPQQRNVPNIRPPAPQNSNACFNCGKPGHYSNVCPYPKQQRALWTPQ